jgi:hypothetical protein
MRICCHLCSRRHFATAVFALPFLDLWAAHCHSLRLMCLWTVVRTDCGFAAWRNRRRIEVHTEVVRDKNLAAEAENIEVGCCCMMVLEVRHIAQDLPSGSLTMSRIEARML